MPYAFHSTAYKTLLELLVAARRQKGLNQTELGKRLGRRQTFVSKIELGERRLDLVEFLILADVLDVDPHEVLKQVKKTIKTRKI